MKSIKTTFTCATISDGDEGPGFSRFWLLVFALAILEDGERREKRRRKRDQAHRPPFGPRP